MNKLAVISGGTKGLGRALSLELGKSGWNITALYKSDSHAAKSLEEEFQGLLGVLTCTQHDVGGTSAWAPEIPEKTESLALIHNAVAPFEPKPFHLLSREDFQAQADVALHGAVSLTQTLIRPMLKVKNAAIIIVLTSALLEGKPVPKGFSAYIASKAALAGLTHSLAAEYASRGIRIFSVSPSFMDTPLTQGWHVQFKEAAAGAFSCQSPAQTALQVVRLLENRSEAPGRGENHALGRDSK